MNRFNIIRTGNLIDIYYDNELLIKNIESSIAKENTHFYTCITNEGLIKLTTLSIESSFIYLEIIEIDTVNGMVYDLCTVNYPLSDSSVHFFRFSNTGLPELLVSSNNSLIELVFSEKEKCFKVQEINIDSTNYDNVGIFDQESIIVCKNDCIQIIKKNNLEVIEENDLFVNLHLNDYTEEPTLRIEPITNSVLTPEIRRLLASEISCNEDYDNMYIEEYINRIITDSSTVFYNKYIFKRDEDTLRIFRRNTIYRYKEYSKTIIENEHVQKVIDYSEGRVEIYYSELANVQFDYLKINRSISHFGFDNPFNLPSINIKFSTGEIIETKISIDYNNSIDLSDPYVYQDVTNSEVQEVIQDELDNKNIDYTKIREFNQQIIAVRNQYVSLSRNRLKSKKRKQKKKRPQKRSKNNRILKNLKGNIGSIIVAELFSRSIDFLSDKYSEYQEEQERLRKEQERQEKERDAWGAERERLQREQGGANSRDHDVDRGRSGGLA